LISLYLEWGILILVLIFGVYTMRVIKNEKDNYLKDAVDIRFNQFKLLVPRWWTFFEGEDSKKIYFKRTDTRYEWQASFQIKNSELSLPIVDLFKKEIEERKILFDEDTSIIYNPSDFSDSPLTKSGEYEMVRLEGTATEDRSERLYLDSYLVRNLKNGEYLFAESKSSVLNGLVEGPYFEEVLYRLEVV